MTDPAKLVESISLSLAAAALDGDMQAAKAAIGFGADVHYECDLALRNAAKRGHTAMLAYLLSAEIGADVNAAGGSALRRAARDGRENVVKMLLDYGADPDVVNGEPLLGAAAKGHTAVVEALLARGADPHFDDDHALVEAAYNGHIGIVAALAGNKADLFAAQGSALTLAEGEKHDEVAAFLKPRMEAEKKAFLAQLEKESPARDFLRAPYGGTGEPAIVRAAKMGCLDAAVARMKAEGDALTAADVHDGIHDRHGTALATLAARGGSLKALFDAAVWRGTLEDVTAAWNKIPGELRQQGGMEDGDFSGVLSAFAQRELRQRAGRLKLKF